MADSLPDLASPTCVTEGCGKERRWKGLCSSCYGQAKKLIKQSKTTWDELEIMGLIIADDQPFVAAFKRKLNERKNTATEEPTSR